MNSRRTKTARRGVLLLLILGILAMFGAVAITLVVIARHAKDTAEINQRMDQQAYDPANDLNEAAMQTFRDTNSPRSVLRGQSLEADYYGDDSVEITIPSTGALIPVGPTYDSTGTTVVNGQLIQFDQSWFGGLQPALRRMGCVVTMLSGPSKGVSMRIVGYDPTGNPLLLAGSVRLLGPDGAPGRAGVDDDSSGTDDDLTEVGYAGSDDAILRGDRFLVNGVPFSGAGFGYSTTSGQCNATHPTWTALPRALLPNPVELGASEDPAGAGGANEDYDAPDYQNLLPAMIIPPIDTDNDGVPDTPTRVVAPSLHRPSLINYWYNRMVYDATPPFGITWPVGMAADEKWRAVLKPWGEDGVAGNADDYAPDVATGQAIVAAKKCFILRARAEDVLPNISTATEAQLQQWYDDVSWDVDCDGDGIRDAIWVDLGFPVRTLPDGRRCKPLFAILCTDLDGRLNLNAHGSLQQTVADYYGSTNAAPLTYAGGFPAALLQRGQGFGPGEINLMPLFDDDPGTWPPDANDLARVRMLMRGPDSGAIDGRYGEAARAAADRQPGRSLDPTNTFAYNDPRSANKLFQFFWDPTTPLDTTSANAFNYYTSVGAPDSIRGTFGTPVDPKGMLSVGIDLRGQPVYRVLDTDGSGGNSADDWQYLAVNDPYDTDMSQTAARGLGRNAPADNLFTAAELERVLRPYDVDAPTLPPRLAALHPAGEASRLVPSATSTLSRRFEVTTDSYDPSSPNVAMTPLLRLQAGNVQSGHVSELFEEAGITAANLPMLVSRDLLAGLRMDLNRPFGNGRDDNGNGVVDDPLEFFPPATVELLPQLDASSSPVSPASSIEFDANNDGAFDALDRQARQDYARDLYVLLMMLVQNDLNGSGTEDALNEIWYPPGLATPPTTIAEAQRIRAHALAQYAINVVDFRDRDSAMTPFEYDPDPLGGGTGRWRPDQNLSTTDGISEPHVVWGCERPEMLFSEALAIHDRRTEDRDDDSGIGTRTDDGSNPDPNFDQKYRPQGSLFVEMFNPWTPDEPLPAEFYYDYAGGAWRNGIVLNQATPSGGNPVWRLVIVREDGASPSPLTLDPDDPNTAARPTIERSVYFMDPASLPAAAHVGTEYYTTAAVQPIPQNGYAVIGSADQAGPDPLVTFLGFEESMTSGDTGSTRYITMDSTTVTAGSPWVVRNNDATVLPPAANVDPPVLVPISEPRRLSITEPTGGYGIPAGATSYDPTTGQYDVAADTPQDEADPLIWNVVRNTATTPSVAKIYLQRLANPLLPWASETDANANPYRTIDAITVDVTAFNGVTNENNHNVAPDGDEDNGSDGNGSTLVTMFHSLERGTAEGAKHDLWRQEVPRVSTDITPDARDISTPHYFPRLLTDTLGYLNAAFGQPRDDSIGYKGASDTAPVFPWFRWANRPFVTPMELTEVPAHRSSILLAVGAFGEYTTAPGFDMLPTANPYTDAAGAFPHLLNFYYSDPPVTGPPAGDFYRLFEFVQVPSPFVGTEVQGNPLVFNGTVGGAHTFHPPFNGISLYRDPGRININTVFSPDVWRGLANYFPGFSTTNFWENYFIPSRRGYAGGTDPAIMVPGCPTRFANPFRSFAGRELVPLASLGSNIGDAVNATLMRADPTDPTRPLFEFLAADGGEYNNPDRNPHFRNEMLEKLSNLVTTRSNVYAVWITEGYFEVDGSGNPGAEIGTDTGDVKRHRAFYIFDRSIPVGFKRGEDLNVERAILLSRFIE